MLQQPLFKEDFFSYVFPPPQYLGAKYRQLPWISKHLPSDVRVAMDVFAGSHSVSFFFKQMGFKVIANDFMNYSNQIGKALIENKHETLTEEDLEILFSDAGGHSFTLFQSLYRNIFFNTEDCRFLDNFRFNINKLQKEKKNLAFAIINRAMTRKVTMGHFAHLKAIEYANNPDRVKRNRSLVVPVKELFLELLPTYNAAVFDNGQDNVSLNLDAREAIRHYGQGADLIYFDPPYCDSHADYQSFYHLLETYTEYWTDKQFVNKTKSYYPRRYSGYVKKKDFMNSLERLFDEARHIRYWIISYNDRSFPSQRDMVNLLKNYKSVDIVKKEYTNSVGGKGSVKGSSELLFLCA